ncbi:MAG: hypothetical protein AAF561_11845 [Planctomycetota bacterium]
MTPLEQRLAAARSSSAGSHADAIAAAYEAGRRDGADGARRPLRLWRSAAGVATAATLVLGVTQLTPSDRPSPEPTPIVEQPLPDFPTSPPSPPSPPAKDSLLALRFAMDEEPDAFVTGRLPVTDTGYRGPSLTAGGRRAG